MENVCQRGPKKHYIFVGISCTDFSKGRGALIIVHAMHIQGDSGGICNTLGNDSMRDSKQKSSCEHGSDFERLPRYGKKKIRTILRARTAIT
jgi:hypothetical protein